jgi:hypothetical protein
VKITYTTERDATQQAAVGCVEVGQRVAVRRFVLQPMQVTGVVECDVDCLRKAAAPDNIG